MSALASPHNAGLQLCASKFACTHNSLGPLHTSFQPHPSAYVRPRSPCCPTQPASHTATPPGPIGIPPHNPPLPPIFPCAVEAFICDSFGRDAWLQIVKQAHVDCNWVSSCPYPDKVTYDLVITGAGILGVSVQQALEGERTRAQGGGGVALRKGAATGGGGYAACAAEPRRWELRRCRAGVPAWPVLGRRRGWGLSTAGVAGRCRAGAEWALKGTDGTGRWRLRSWR